MVPDSRDGIKCGDKIFDRTSGASARVSAFVVSQDGTLFILTTARAVNSEGCSVVDQSGRSLGEPLVGRFDPGPIPELQPIAGAFGLVRLDRGIIVCAGSGDRETFNGLVDEPNLLGLTVLNSLHPGGVPGKVISVGIPLHIRERPSHRLVHFADGLHVVASRQNADFAVQGDAGGAVTTPTGQLVGFVLGISPGQAFLARADKVIGEYGVQLATTLEIQKHNDMAATTRGKVARNLQRPIDPADWAVVAHFADNLTKSPKLFRSANSKKRA